VNLSRRSLFGLGAGAAVVASLPLKGLLAPLPAIVEEAMPVAAAGAITGNQLLTLQMITKDAVRIWKSSNHFLANIDSQYNHCFAERLQS
jgi:hypothetical protein